MSWIDALTESFISKAATNVDEGFARYLEKDFKEPLAKKFALSQRNNAINAQMNKEAAKQVFNQVSGGAALRDLKLAAKSTLGKSTPEEEAEFLKKNPESVGLDFAGAAVGILGPAYAARGANALFQGARNVVQPVRAVERMLEVPGSYEATGARIFDPTMVQQRAPFQARNLLRLLGKPKARELIQSRNPLGHYGPLIPK